MGAAKVCAGLADSWDGSPPPPGQLAHFFCCLSISFFFLSFPPFRSVSKQPDDSSVGETRHYVTDGQLLHLNTQSNPFEAKPVENAPAPGGCSFTYLSLNAQADPGGPRRLRSCPVHGLPSTVRNAVGTRCPGKLEKLHHHLPIRASGRISVRFMVVHGLVHQWFGVDINFSNIRVFLVVSCPNHLLPGSFYLLGTVRNICSAHRLVPCPIQTLKRDDFATITEIKPPSIGYHFNIRKRAWIERATPMTISGARHPDHRVRPEMLAFRWVVVPCTARLASCVALASMSIFSCLIWMVGFLCTIPPYLPPPRHASCGRYSSSSLIVRR